MGIINIIANIKQIHPKDIILVSIGKFYYSYGKDAYILSYMFKYKLMEIKGTKVCSVAFPKQSFPKVKAQLENNKINYIVVDRRNNYEVDEKSDNKNLNTYSKKFEKAHKYVNIKKSAERIYTYIINNIEEKSIKQKIEKMEEIINETGKI